MAAALIIFWQMPIDLAAIGLMAGSAVLHTAYFVLLNEGYRAGDLSLVYPLARGTGPLLSSLAAILFLGERPSTLAIAGGLLVVLGVAILTMSPQMLRGRRLCEPCAHMEKLTVKGALRGLIHRGGVRAEIVKGGTIRVGDVIASCS